MLTLHELKCRNFRALRNVDITFADDAKKPLTVIRAENRSGKTTMLNALGWVLFGDEALPESRQKYRLHPIDWEVTGDNNRVLVVGELTFTTDQDDVEKEYRVIRSTTDVITQNSWKADQTDLVLQVKTPAGWSNDPTPMQTMGRLFPISLHKVFLTDGDSTLTFIESSDQSNQRRSRVQSSVRALLQIDLLESALRHVKLCRSDASASLSRSRQNESDKKLFEDVETLRAEIEMHDSEIASLSSELLIVEQWQRDNQEKIDVAFQASGGDPAILTSQRLQDEEMLKKLKDNLIKVHQGISAFFEYENSAPSLAARLFPQVLRKVGERLQELESAGKIPNIMPSVIQDRLDRFVCICGQPLDVNSPARLRLEQILKESERQSAYSPILMNIQSDLRQWRREAESETSKVHALDEYEDKVHEITEQIKAKQHSIDEAKKRLENSDLLSLGNLKEEREKFKTEGDEVRGKLNRARGQREAKSNRLHTLEPRYKELASQTKRGESASYMLKAADDLATVLEQTIERLGKETLDQVSTKMNGIFHAMNVSSDNQNGSVIDRIELTTNYDILVHGSHGRELKPSTDLSGAQKRALTLSFILSMVEVSGFEAPNIIDTPLGTQSGQFRRNMLEYTAKNSKQLILFLTKDEIAGVEDILEKYASRYWTLTNKAQQDELVNTLSTTYNETIVCECGIRSECQICARKPLF